MIPSTCWRPGTPESLHFSFLLYILCKKCTPQKMKRYFWVHKEMKAANYCRRTKVAFVRSRVRKCFAPLIVQMGQVMGEKVKLKRTKDPSGFIPRLVTVQTTRHYSKVNCFSDRESIEVCRRTLLVSRDLIIVPWLAGLPLSLLQAEMWANQVTK